MPELPEVATMVKALRSRIMGRRVRHVVAESRGLLDGTTPSDLSAALYDTIVSGVKRHGKYVRIDFDPPPRRAADRAMKRAPATGSSVVARRPETLEELLQARPLGKPGRSRPATEVEARELFDSTRFEPGDSCAARASLIIHLKMTGRFFVMNDNGHPVPQRSRLVLAVEGREDDLLFGIKDTRRLARVWLLEPDEAHAWPKWLKLGPDAVSGRFSGERLARLASGRLPIKLALLDQSRIAGLGNIYACEVLHRTRIHPARPATELSSREWGALAREVPKLLRTSMEKWCEASRWIGPAVEGYGDFNGSLKVYDRAGAACRRCGGEIRTLRQAGRTTFYCGGCQK
ncbi:MAG TPA: DNA-formamidopyrimidine glycosylase family protein [Arenibaculum sp.]|nr:DNA-formamidopyrimidine glycosylase family protein [Arenibaculum sp.]